MLYDRISEFTPERHCGEWLAVCPDCGWSVCVYCEDACESCGESLF